MVGDFTTSVERKVKGMGTITWCVESAEERKRIIDSIQHNQPHLGQETKHLKSPPWPELYNDVCSYVSLSSLFVYLA